jgi:hypothetical protein
MKKLFVYLVITQLIVSCAYNRIGSGGWPARTRDSQLLVKGDKSALSAMDITAIHEFVWSKNANIRILGIQIIDSKKVLLTCTDQPGDRFQRMLGFDLIRTGGGWVEGNYISTMKAN